MEEESERYRSQDKVLEGPSRRMKYDCCKAEYEHENHQRCNKCGCRIAVPIAITSFTNSSICNDCPGSLYQVIKEQIEKEDKKRFDSLVEQIKFSKKLRF